MAIKVIIPNKKGADIGILMSHEIPRPPATASHISHIGTKKKKGQPK